MQPTNDVAGYILSGPSAGSVAINSAARNEAPTTSVTFLETYQRQMPGYGYYHPGDVATLGATEAQALISANAAKAN